MGVQQSAGVEPTCGAGDPLLGEDGLWGRRGDGCRVSWAVEERLQGLAAEEGRGGWAPLPGPCRGSEAGQALGDHTDAPTLRMSLQDQATDNIPLRAPSHRCKDVLVVLLE